MRKQAWIAAGMAVALTTAASAARLQVRYWPVTFVPQELVTIPVVMDVGLWMDIAVQGETLRLQQVDVVTFQGCVDVRVRSNFDSRLLYSIAPTGVIGGQYSTLPEHADVDAPGGMTTVCGRLAGADLSDVPGGRRDVNVATLTISVIPRP